MECIKKKGKKRILLLISNFYEKYILNDNKDDVNEGKSENN